MSSPPQRETPGEVWLPVVFLLVAFALTVPLVVGLYMILEAGRTKVGVGLCLLPVVAVSLIICWKRDSLYMIADLLCATYWLPFHTPLSTFSFFNDCMVFEFGMGGLLVMTLLRLQSTVQKANAFRRGFPWFGFLLYAFGPLVTWALTSAAAVELSSIRIVFMLPLVITYVVYRVVLRPRVGMRLVWMLLTSGGAFALLYVYGSTFETTMQASWYNDEAGRVGLGVKVFGASFTVLPQMAGICFGMPLVCAFCLWLTADVVWKQVVSGILILVFVLTIFVAQARTGTLAFGVCSVVACILTMRMDRHAGMRAAVKTVLVLALLAGGTVATAYSSGNIEKINRISRYVKNVREDPNYVGRAERWNWALDVVMAHPLGVGLYGFRKCPSGEAWDAHNLWLFLALSGGIVTLGGFVWVFIVFARAYWAGMRSSDPDTRLISMVGACGLVFTVVAGQFTMLTWEPYTVASFWVLLAAPFAVASLRGTTGRNYGTQRVAGSADGVAQALVVRADSCRLR